jgi:hypothetical protein
MRLLIIFFCLSVFSSASIAQIALASNELPYKTELKITDQKVSAQLEKFTTEATINKLHALEEKFTKLEKKNDDLAKENEELKKNLLTLKINVHLQSALQNNEQLFKEAIVENEYNY